jgi:hypothetical protein
MGDEFSTSSVQDLFFVATDAGDRLLAEACVTIDGLYRHFFERYMETRPSKPVRVYLFKDKESFDAWHRKKWGSDPDTPYGFYLKSERTMVMNISTGLGTLCHEMVQPLIESDFPSCPAWFNEGFASLFEQCDARFRGLVNWRLKRLREGSVPSLREVMRTATAQFYGNDKAANYAVARYLCYYLQEKKLLEKYYREFRDHVGMDPSGIKTLERVLGMRLDEFESEFRTFCLHLR